MATPTPSSRFSVLSIQKTVNWALTQDIPTDITIKVGESSFPLHKFMLVAKSAYIEREVTIFQHSDLSELDLSEIPGGSEAFEKVVKFCYGINFEITVHNVVALRCAAEYLEMTEEQGQGSLVERTEEFISKAALRTLTGAVAVLRSCEGSLFEIAMEMKIVQRCIDAISLKVITESNCPTRSPTNWWSTDIAAIPASTIPLLLAALRRSSASPQTLSTTISALLHRHLLSPTSADNIADHHHLLETLITALPSHSSAPLSPSLLCHLLRAAATLSPALRRDLERRISSSLHDVIVSDILALALDPDGERVGDLDCVRRIVAGFLDDRPGAEEMGMVARVMDGFVGEIATDEELSVSRFVGIAGALPKSARRFDDDLYRAVDIFLKAHPRLDEIEREKVCRVMDPLKLSYEARLHASQNKRLPLQIVLHALYYDQLKLRSGIVHEPAALDTNTEHKQRKSSMSLVRENEALKSELAQMKMYVSDIQKGQGSGSAKAAIKKPKFFSSMSRTLGKLNPFKHGSKDTSHIEDIDEVNFTKPRRRRFSIS